MPQIHRVIEAVISLNKFNCLYIVYFKECYTHFLKDCLVPFQYEIESADELSTKKNREL